MEVVAKLPTAGQRDGDLKLVLKALSAFRRGEQGVTLPSPDAAKHLQPLLAEGLYRVGEAFTCCEKNCRTFEQDMLVQLGYDGQARPILFMPQWKDEGLDIPERGQLIDTLRLAKLEFLVVPENRTARASHLH